MISSPARSATQLNSTAASRRPITRATASRLSATSSSATATTATRSPTRSRPKFERHYKNGLLLNFAYTYLDQKSTALDTGNSSLGGIAYDSLNPDQDYGIDGYTSKHRFVAYGVWDLPVGRRRRYGANMNGVGRRHHRRLVHHL